MEKMKNVTDTRIEGLDKFYTVESVVNTCISSVSKQYDWNTWELVIEPSAGNGSFFHKIPVPNDKKIGLDIQSEHLDIIEKDFFDYEVGEKNGKILVIGNPPFGRNCSIAVKFFNHASNWCDTIAFIIPRTFRRESIQNRLNLKFHLILDEEIPIKPCSFTPPMMVKCCFQIWEKRDYKREIVKLDTSHDDWDFLSLGPNDDKNQPTPPSNTDFVIRAYGGKCGEIKTDNMDNLRPKSWHWIKCNKNKEELIDKFSKLDYSNCLNTARQNSLGRGELVKLYRNYMN
jgi:predicted RNA methylase